MFSGAPGQGGGNRVCEFDDDEGIIMAWSQVITERLKIAVHQVSEISHMVYVSQMCLFII
ncbi:MAG: hypothetical protein R3311_00235 [Oceanisphaera sp.]|nr:hypothetical protein [Oceanisphaera sp.]